uniref:Uncharacterized protein n=1 Tax=viral metagenome TaxID=1070528 RepID=A0A6C0C731_9ZZZZ
MLPQKIELTRDLHVTFNGSLKIECNIAAKNYICAAYLWTIEDRTQKDYLR